VIPAPTSSDKPHLLRLPNWLGDFILALPSVHLYQRWLNQRAPLLIVGPPTLSSLAPILLPGIEYIPAPSFPFALHSILKKKQVSAATLLPNSLRVTFETLPISYRAGFSRPLRNFLLTEHKPRRTSPYGYVHVADQYLGLLEDLGLPKGKAELPPPPNLPKPEDAPSQPYLAILPGAAYGSAKRWDPASFASVIRELQKSHSLQPILMGGPGDVEACQAVAQSLGSPVTDLSGKTTTLELADWLAHSSLILCHDSGPMHLAAFLRKPAVAIFGSTEPAWTGPLGSTVSIAQHKVSCSPCFLKTCPLDRRCMTRLTPEEVLTACVQRLNQK
jgi:heptosyltransferase II